MDEEHPEFEEPDETDEEIRLAQLEQAAQKGEPWTREDQEWIAAQLRQAWEDVETERMAPYEEAAELELDDR